MAFKSGSKTTTTGVRVALTDANDYYCSITIQAKTANAGGTIFLGESTVSTTVFAFELAAGEAITLTSSEGDPINTKQIYLDVTGGTVDGVTWGGIAR